MWSSPQIWDQSATDHRFAPANVVSPDFMDATCAMNMLIWAWMNGKFVLDPTVVVANWFFIAAKDREQASDVLKREFEHKEHPFQTFDIFLQRAEVLALRGAGVKVYYATQGVGCSIFIPVGSPHQVANTCSAFKIAVDYLPVASLGMTALVQEERIQYQGRAIEGDLARVPAHAIAYWQTLLNRQTVW
ncbi:hypothetical protein P7C70_g9460, partial [Phenoliferia sp. Uapishka_3]